MQAKVNSMAQGKPVVPAPAVRYNGNTVEQIGRYRVVGEIGRGAMGVVYKAEDPAIGRTVAIKTIRLGDLTDPSERQFMRERLLREARSAGILSHPGIVTIYDIAEEGDTAYVFMEFVSGQTLDKLVAGSGVLEKKRVFEILRQTAAALDYAHSKGIVHRDIKPANIMISADGQAKITDFGVAKILSQQMTQTRSILGTPYYMSPEQIQGAAIDGRSDQFALAVVAFELLTGERPYAADSLPTLLYKIVKEAPASPRRFNPSLAPEVDHVLRKAFAKDPQQRFSTCTEFVSALAMAASKNPDWQPLPRGGAASMETAVSSPGPALPAAPAGPEKGGDRGQERAPAMPPLRAGPRRLLELEEEERRQSSLVRRVVLVVLVAVAVAAAAKLAPERLGFDWAELAASLAGEQPIEEPALTAPAFQPPAPPPGFAAGAATVAPPPPGGAAPAPEPPAATGAPGQGEVTARLGAGAPEAEPAAVQTPKPAPVKPVPVKPAPAKSTPARPARPKEYWVEIRSDPPGARVAADEDPELVCKTPCELPLTAGRHVLRLTQPGYRLAPRIIQVPEILDVTVRLDRRAGTLAITSKPPGAAIFLNGEQRPEKTPAMIKLPVGNYKIRLTLPGRPPFEDTVEVKDQVITSIGVDW